MRLPRALWRHERVQLRGVGVEWRAQRGGEDGYEQLVCRVVEGDEGSIVRDEMPLFTPGWCRCHAGRERRLMREIRLVCAERECCAVAVRSEKIEFI